MLLTGINPGAIAFDPNLDVAMPNAEFITPDSVSLIALKAIKGGEYVIALESNLVYFAKKPVCKKLTTLLTLSPIL